MSDNERDDTQRYTACLKRDIFERDIGRDMSDQPRPRPSSLLYIF